MQTGDGLLARLRPVRGILLPSQLRDIAMLASRFGNGQVEITARGNLQVRGLTAAMVTPFATAVENLIEVDIGTPIEVSPLAGLDPSETANARPLAAAIRTALARSSVAGQLGPKVTVVVDGGGTWDRAELAADIRLTAAGEDRWRLEIGGRPLGLLFEHDAADATLIILSMIAAVGGRGRNIDPTAARQRLHGFLLADAALPARSLASSSSVPLTDGRYAAAIWLPFGAVPAGILIDLAEAAIAADVDEFRLAPHHGLIAICTSKMIASQLQGFAASLGLVTTTTDARRAISACIGTDGCASGFVPARRIAGQLAQSEPDFFDQSFALHVSGCSKGCAHPAPALLTLIGAGAGLDLTVNGTAHSPPALNLPPDTAQIAVQRLAALWRDERALGESVAACFKRLGAASIAAAVRQGLQ
jgi:precorrin-3B synthase